jgi:DUF4097 and DUF4098 domain-containing protein YvlB
MKKTAIAILIAVLVVAIGGALVFAGLSAVHFKVRDLNTTDYVTNTHDVGEGFTRVEMDIDTADVNIQPAEDGRCRVVCLEWEKYPHTVTVENGALIVRSAKDQKWNVIGIQTKGPSVTVYLPAADYESLKVDADTGAVKLAAGVSFETVDVDADTGAVTVDGADVKKLKITADTGKIVVENMTPETLELDADTGSIRVTDVVCSGDMRIEADTGSIRLTDVDGANLYLKADTGSISGTIRTGKEFYAKSSTGSVHVPESTSGGRCEAHTGTGSIRLSISGK